MAAEERHLAGVRGKREAAVVDGGALWEDAAHHLGGHAVVDGGLELAERGAVGLEVGGVGLGVFLVDVPEMVRICEEQNVYMEIDITISHSFDLDTF